MPKLQACELPRERVTVNRRAVAADTIGRMANSEHLDILSQGVKAWNAWRSNDANTIPDLRGSCLKDVSLSYAKLMGADVRKAVAVAHVAPGWGGGVATEPISLRGANLTGTNLAQSTLIGVDFTRSVLSDADITRARVGW